MNKVFVLLFYFSLLQTCITHAQFEKNIFGKEKEPKTVKELATKLVAGKANDSLKVDAIYSWITKNISYDYAVFMSGQPLRLQTPEIVFRRRKTTCTGYSNLMVYLLTEAGIPAYAVEGFTHDFTLGLDTTKLSSDHAWVAFSLNGKWELADPTWDAGQIGYLYLISKEKVKKTFWQRLKSFKFKNLFKRKKRKNNKFQTRIKVSYKKGFVSNPSRDYIFVDPNEFLKTHLPNVAHAQMKSAPITVEQYCDSAHALGDKYYRSTGNYNFNKVNDSYFALEYPERLLWLSDSSLNYHYLNNGDKALNAHNYLAHFYGERTSSIPLLNNFIAIADTVLVHGKIAIALNKAEFKRKKLEFTEAFTKERKNTYEQQRNCNYIQTHINNNATVYGRGRDRMQLKENVLLNALESKIIEKYGFPHVDTFPLKYDTLPEIKALKRKVQLMSDSIKKLQEIEIRQGDLYIEMMNTYFISARNAMQRDLSAQFEGQFLNEKEFFEYEKQLIDSLKLLNSYMRDSVNAYTGNRPSFVLLTKFDKEIKAMETNWAMLQKKDSLFPAWAYYTQTKYAVYDLLVAEQTIIQKRVKQSRDIESSIRLHFKQQMKDLSLDMKDVSYIKTMRQAYLLKMLNNKYNRSIRVYTIIISNAKKWKELYTNKIKVLETR